MSANWYESDSLWSALKHRFDSPEAWALAPTEVDAIIELAELDRAAWIADLAAGTGRLSIELARRGHQVTAVERHPAFVRGIAKRAEGLDPGVEIVRRDMLGFERAEGFDALLLWGDSLGYFDSIAQDRAFFARCARSCRPEGKLVISLTPKEHAERSWPMRTWVPLPGDRLLLEENVIIRNFSAIGHTWILVEGKERKTMTGTRRLYSAAELAGELYTAGFTEVECFGDLEGGPFGRNSRTLVVIATR